jgi:hypothetical protein
VPQNPVSEEPLAIAVRSQERLIRALAAVGIAAGPGALRLYADLDALGAPIVVIGPLTVEAADRLSQSLEGSSASHVTAQSVVHVTESAAVGIGAWGAGGAAGGAHAPRGEGEVSC